MGTGVSQPPSRADEEFVDVCIDVREPKVQRDENPQEGQESSLRDADCNKSQPHLPDVSEIKVFVAGSMTQLILGRQNLMEFCF